MDLSPSQPEIPAPAPPLLEATQALRRTLPSRPAPVTLTGKWVRLEPLDITRQANALFAMSHGAPIQLGDRRVEAYDAEEMIWRYLFGGPYADLDAFTAYLISQRDAANALTFCVVDQATGTPVGVTNYMNNFPEHLKIELGGIWYSPIVQRTPANTEATLLMLEHAFGLGYRRVEWKCDARNQRSRRAALRMGFTFECIQEYHFIIKGRSRDTAWYRILDHEWPGVRSHLHGLLAAHAA
jgi:RimJ/RimL family protein N-acetyltransferase